MPTDEIIRPDGIEEPSQPNEPRKPGRPRKVNISVEPPKEGSTEPTEPKRTWSRKKKPTKAEVAQSIGTALVTAQMVTLLVQPALVPDALTANEVARLSTAIADELLLHPSLVQYLSAATEANVHITLAVTVLELALPRLARHGVIPKEFANVVPNQGGSPSVPMEPGGTPMPDWGHGNGEINASGQTPEYPTVPVGYTDETGRRTVSGASRVEIPTVIVTGE